MTPASRPSVCWKGESRDGAVTALHGQQPAGDVNAPCAAFQRHCRGSGWSPWDALGMVGPNSRKFGRATGQMKKPNGNRM